MKNKKKNRTGTWEFGISFVEVAWYRYLYMPKRKLNIRAFKWVREPREGELVAPPVIKGINWYL